MSTSADLPTLDLGCLAGAATGAPPSDNQIEAKATPSLGCLLSTETGGRFQPNQVAGFAGMRNPRPALLRCECSLNFPLGSAVVPPRAPI